MKKNLSERKISDNLFQQGVSCPLKLFHYTNEKNAYRTEIPFKQRNKLRLRDAVAFQYDNVKFTSDNPETAAAETEKWLNEPRVTICGAVIEADDCYTRMPILRKEDDQYSVIQIHGKLRKRSQIKEIREAGKSRSTDLYLLKAAYRVEILKRKFPDAVVRVQFFFPKREFKAKDDNLLQRADPRNITDIKTRDEIRNLLASVEATEGTDQMRSALQESVTHARFLNLSIAEAISELKAYLKQPARDYGVDIHNGCKYCKYRIKEDGDGCWEEFFDQKKIEQPQFHVFELIGHGNNIEAENGFFYQEEVPVNEAFHTFEAIRMAGGKTITIQQRRILQLLKAKKEPVPKIWAKPGVNVIQTLKFPLHFIDFEAATYALPLKRNGGPYDPVYFQFSCHTLHKNGNINHTEWLDSKPESGYPHRDFLHNLANIKDIYEGTLVQYSPFEGQALNYLYREFGRNSMLHKEELSILDRLRSFQSKGESPRLFDLSKLIREFYFNYFFEGGLGLKSVLNDILKTMKANSVNEQYRVKVYDYEVDLFSGEETGNTPNPYREIQHPEYKIEDGAEAMNAYISMKCKNLSGEETKIIPPLLKRYCALDSYALVVIFKHLEQLTKRMARDEDLIIF